MYFSPSSLLLIGNIILNGNGSIINCGLTKFISTTAFDGVPKENAICVRWNFLKYTMKTRPWNCQIQVDIFPIPDQMGIQLFKYNDIEPSYNKAFLYFNVPSLNIVFTTETPTDRYTEQQWKNWVSQRIKDLGNQMSHELFVVCVINRVLKNTAAGMSKLYVLQSGGIYENGPYGQVYKIDFEEVSEETLQSFYSLSTISFPGPMNKNRWYLFGYGSDQTNENPMDMMKKYNIPTRYISKFPFNDMLHRQIYAYGHLLSSLIGNGSLTFVTERNDWYSGFGITLTMYTVINYEARHFAIFLPGKINSFRFISCGERGHEAIAYQQVFIAYDWCTWVLIVLWVYVLACFIKTFENFQGIGIFQLFCIKPHILYVYKVLVEQGNPFPDQFLKDVKLIFILIPFMFMGTVLSNAYKNTNIYNMISPRNSILYDTFQELINDKFSMLSRSYDIEIFVRDIRNYTRFREGGHYMALGTGNIFSELYQFKHHSMSKLVHKTEGNWISELGASNHSLKKQSALMDLVYDHSKLYEGMINVMHNNVVKRNLRNESVWMYNHWHIVIPKEELEIKTLEMDLLYWLVKNCSEAAVVIPEYIGYLWAKQLQRDGETRVSVGKESVFQRNLVFTLAGRIPSYVFIRVRGMEMSGLWERWTQFFREMALRNKRKPVENVMAPNMSGNILIIFIIWGIGAVMSILSYLWEIKYMLWGNISSVISVMWLNFKSSTKIFRMFDKRESKGKSNIGFCKVKIVCTLEDVFGPID